MSDVFRKYLNKTTNCSTYFCYANWEKILRNLASSVRSNSISECSSEARKTLKTWFRPDTIKMSLDALNLYLTAVVAIAELYDVGNNLVEFNKLIRETGKTTVIEQMSKLAKNFHKFLMRFNSRRISSKIPRILLRTFGNGWVQKYNSRCYQLIVDCENCLRKKRLSTL